jgi:hypothetical protein
LLSELRVSCKNKAEGCIEELSLEKVEEHENMECQFEIIACAGAGDGCQELLSKRDMQVHEQSCQLIPVQCKFCKK